MQISTPRREPLCVRITQIEALAGVYFHAVPVSCAASMIASMLTL
jgi:hypothetical protein